MRIDDEPERQTYSPKLAAPYKRLPVTTGRWRLAGLVLLLIAVLLIGLLVYSEAVR
jgi:hypothetical protein